MSKSNYKATALKAGVIALLLYIAIPTIDDAFTIPIIALFLKLPILLVAAIYYAIAWLLVLLVETVL